ncbi:HEPN domain-containing protein [Rhodocaloribacter sp.]
MEKRIRCALKTAHLMLKEGDAGAAVNRSYYAAFYAATAALLSTEEASRTHKGGIRRFNLRFVQPGSFPLDVGAVLAFAAAARQQANYDAFTVFEEAAVADLITDVERFVQAVATRLDA